MFKRQKMFRPRQMKVTRAMAYEWGTGVAGWSIGWKAAAMMWIVTFRFKKEDSL